MSPCQSHDWLCPFAEPQQDNIRSYSSIRKSYPFNARLMLRPILCLNMCPPTLNHNRLVPARPSIRVWFIVQHRRAYKSINRVRYLNDSIESESPLGHYSIAVGPTLTGATLWAIVHVSKSTSCWPAIKQRRRRRWRWRSPAVASTNDKTKTLATFSISLLCLIRFRTVSWWL